jgi:predicted RNA-binding protein with PUA-like domain
MKYWLLKTEPDTFSIDDLIASKNQTTSWEGVRNYQARNFLREMKKDDLGFFYHSSCEIPGIVGLVKIAKESYPDPTAFQETSPYYDPKSNLDKPRWVTVDVKLVKKFNKMVSLRQLRSNPQLTDLIVLKKGSRLSVMPVEMEHFNIILAMK